jgi:hypothetical protein
MSWLAFLTLSGAIQAGPNGAAFGSDFAMFWGATTVMKHGGNPYDPDQVYRAERGAMSAEGAAMMNRSPIVRVGNPPLFFWLLRPLTALSFRTAAWLWIASMATLLLVGWMVLLRYLGWNSTARATAAFLVAPQTDLAVFYGNVTGLFFAALCFSLALARRHPLAAGSMSAIGWLRPQLALPFVLLIWLFHATSRTRFAMGFTIASVALSALTLAAAGPRAGSQWVHALAGYSAEIDVQPNLASLSGVYARTAPLGVRTPIEILLLLVALGLTVFWWGRLRQDRTPLADYSPVAWLWFAWFLATPYAHFNDEILLAFPILVLLRRDAAGICHSRAVAVLYLMYLSVLLFSFSLDGVQMLWAPLLCVAVLSLLDARERLALDSTVRTRTSITGG